MTVKIGFKPHHLILPFVRNLDREGVIVLMGDYDADDEVDGDADHDGPDGGVGQYPSSEAGAGNRWRHRAYIYCPPVVKMVTSITFLFKCS